MSFRSQTAAACTSDRWVWEVPQRDGRRLFEVLPTTITLRYFPSPVRASASEEGEFLSVRIERGGVPQRPHRRRFAGGGALPLARAAGLPAKRGAVSASSESQVRNVSRCVQHVPRVSKSVFNTSACVSNTVCVCPTRPICEQIFVQHASEAGGGALPLERAAGLLGTHKTVRTRSRYK